MIKAWEKLSYFGIDFASDVQERKTIPLINKMSIVLTILMITFSSVGFFMGLYDILYFAIPFSVAFGLTPFFQKKGWLNFSRYYFSFSPLVCVIAICLYNGEGMGDKFFFFATALAPIIVIRKQSMVIVFYLISMAAFFFIMWYQSNYPPIKAVPADIEKYYLVLTLTCLFIILFFIVNYFRKGNEEYEHELEIKNSLINEKNKDILDSMHYARRIQRALMASDKLLNNYLKDYFIVYMPKEVVSGDFYWAEEGETGKFLLLTGDCTGHGVPGAFMSLLNITILNELTTRMKITRPDEVLNTQRDAIVMSLNPDGADVVSKDGMDCVLCSFDFKSLQLNFACANNPLWVWRNNEMIEFKPDKLPVGIHEGEKKKFTLHSFQLEKGDIVYTFTDGFADQFGGEGGKKYKYKKFKEKLAAVSVLPMEEQKKALETEFIQWKGNLEQVDDVLIIGVKIK